MHPGDSADTMTKLNVSVAMATCNGARFIKEQLDSFARQTLLPSELVACDDGSTDETVKIVQQFGAESPFPVRIYRNPERLGYRDNFLQALELCEGNLVAFSDQDDVWLPEKLAVCAGEFESEGTQMVIHLAKLTDPDLESLSGTWPYISRFGTKPLPLWDLLNFEFTGSTMVFRRQVAQPLMKNPQLRQAFSGHDLAVGFLAGARGRVARRKQVLSLHRCHDENVSTSHDIRTSSALAYIRSTPEDRSRLLAAMRWSKTHTKLTSTVGEKSYAIQAQDIACRAKMFLQAAACADQPLRAVLEKSSKLLSKRAAALAERSYLYRDTRGRAFVRFCRMLARGRYKRREFGGLGFLSFAKDCRFLFVSAPSERISQWPAPDGQ